MADNQASQDQQLRDLLLNEQAQSPWYPRAHVRLSDSDKIAFLLNALDFHMGEIQRREEKEQTMFDWCTNLLLLTFGAVIALSGQSNPLPFAFEVKSIASILIAIPTGIFISRILIQRSRAQQNAYIAERIRDIFHVYDLGYYHDQTLYPAQWKGGLPSIIGQRKTPLYFSGVLIFMAMCVIGAIWRIL